MNEDFHACGDKVMICPAVIEIKVQFGEENISFVLCMMA